MPTKVNVRFLFPQAECPSPGTPGTINAGVTDVLVVNEYRQTLWKLLWIGLKRLKIKLPYKPDLASLGFSPKAVPPQGYLPIRAHSYLPPASG